MTGIQIVLILFLLLILFYTISKLRTRKLDLIVLGLLILTGIILVLVPDYTIVLAKKLGVGRGADLIFYVSILTFWYLLLNMYIRIRKLELALTQIVRSEALRNASPKS